MRTRNGRALAVEFGVMLRDKGVVRGAKVGPRRRIELVNPMTQAGKLVAHRRSPDSTVSRRLALATALARSICQPVDGHRSLRHVFRPLVAENQRPSGSVIVGEQPRFLPGLTQAPDTGAQ